MKKVIIALFAITGLSFSFVSCKLGEVSPETNTSGLSTESQLADFTALATADTTKKGPKDKGGNGKDFIKKLELTEIDIATLSNTIAKYISTNYVGASVLKAAQNADKSKTFVAIRKADNSKALLEFDAAGAFVNERTHKVHLKGTKLDVANLPQAIKDYIAKNYVGSTTNRAIQSDKGILVDLKKADGTVVGLLFNADGSFNKEVTIKPKK